MDNTKVILPIFKVPVWIYSFLLTLEGKFLQGRKEDYFVIEAVNKTEARLSLTKEPNFWKNYNKVSPKERKKIKGPFFRLKREGKIVQILECGKRHKNKIGEYVCGRPVHSLSSDERRFYGDKMSGELGLCCIEGYSPLDSEECPYNYN